MLKCQSLKKAISFGRDIGGFVLILTRLIGQSIVIGNNITITIKPGRNGEVKLGVRAPKEIKIHREEVYQRVREREPA